MMRIWLGALLALFLPALAAAQPNMRSIDAAATADWRHAQTGLILASEIAGLARGSIQDSGSEELDVAAQYTDGPNDLVGTIYVFRLQIPSVPVWFDRARTMVERLPIYGLNGGDGRPATAFALPGSSVATGLRVTYPLAARGLTSTALVIAPVNGWIVKVRFSSRTLGPAELDQLLGQFLSGIRWPTPAAAAAAPVRPIEPCPRPLAFKKARLTKPDMTQTLMGSLLALAASSKSAKVLSSYCRDPASELIYGVYRAEGTSNGYVLGLADAGRAVGVSESVSIEEGKKAPFGVTLLELGHSAVFPSFDRLPQPSQVMEMLGRTRPLSSSKVGSTEINIAAEPK